MALSELLVLVALLILSGFFSGSETALTSLSQVRAEAFLKQGRLGARSLYQLKSNTNRMLISILIGNNVVNIGASAMATVIATEMFGHLGPGLAVGVLTFLILVFGEITPKTFAARYAGRISLLVAPPLLWFTRLALPLVWALERLTVFLQSRTRVDTDPTVTESELISLAEHGAEEGTIEPDEKEMITRIFAFTDLRARDVMIPARKVFILDQDCTIGDALPKIVAHPYTRIPLRSGKSPDIVIEQVVYLRDVLSELYKGHTKKRLKAVAHDTPLFAALNQPVEQLFDTLRGHEERPVVVVDEYGALQGMFTLEDMLEELVGEIHDETDKAGRWVHEVKQGALVVKGTEKLRTVEEHLSVYLSGKPTDSVSHWVLEHVEHIPRAGARFIIDGLEVRIVKASRRRIQKVRLACTIEGPAVEDESTTAEH